MQVKILVALNIHVSSMRVRTQILWVVVIVAAVIGIGLLPRAILGPRILARALAPDGTEMYMVQESSWKELPWFTTSFVYRKPGGAWGRFYYHHEDNYWSGGRVAIDTNAGVAVFYRRGSPAVTFAWGPDPYTMHRWNRTMTGAQ